MSSSWHPRPIELWGPHPSLYGNDATRWHQRSAEKWAPITSAYCYTHTSMIRGSAVPWLSPTPSVVNRGTTAGRGGREPCPWCRLSASQARFPGSPRPVRRRAGRAAPSPRPACRPHACRPALPALRYTVCCRAIHYPASSHGSPVYALGARHQCPAAERPTPGRPKSPAEPRNHGRLRLNARTATPRTFVTNYRLVSQYPRIASSSRVV